MSPYEGGLIERTTFTTAEVCELAGVTYRQLYNWARLSALFRPTWGWNEGSGSRQVWSEDDLARTRKAGACARALGPISGSSAAVRIEWLERFVREAVRDGDRWLWVTDDFEVTVRAL